MVRPRHASTVVLARPDADDGFEILLTRRPQEMKFLGGFYVFPGGTVHASDCSPKVLKRCRGITGDQARSALGNSLDVETALGHWSAVVRELFEEVGVLLCVTEPGAFVDLSDAAAREKTEGNRRALVGKQLDFGTLLESENLYCDLSRLAYFDHWITPEIYPMRFDTRFFITALPPNQTALTSSEEVTHGLWIKPEEALIRMDRRDFPILPPTTTVLKNLSRFSSWTRLCGEFELAQART